MAHPKGLMNEAKEWLEKYKDTVTKPSHFLRQPYRIIRSLSEEREELLEACRAAFDYVSDAYSDEAVRLFNILEKTIARATEPMEPMSIQEELDRR